MKPDKIYLVIGSHGCYEDYSTWVESAFYDKEEAEKAVERLKNHEETWTDRMPIPFDVYQKIEDEAEYNSKYNDPSSIMAIELGYTEEQLEESRDIVYDFKWYGESDFNIKEIEIK